MSTAAEASRSFERAPRNARRGAFASLKIRNFRLFLVGQFCSNTGTWVQRIAQDWLVLSLTGSPTDVGLTAALQFTPTVLFGMVGGVLADRYSKRRILLTTQTGMAAMAAILTVLALSGAVRVWHVWIIAFCLGTFASVDMPTRQAFVNEIVGGAHLRNAISLNAAVFQVGALVGPAVSGVSIQLVGAGYSFLINAVSYLGPIFVLLRMNQKQLIPVLQASRAGSSARRQIVEGLRYARAHPEIWWLTMLTGTFGMFITSLPVTLAAYANTVFRSEASGYGFLSAVVAAGSIGGALLVAVRGRIRVRVIFVTAGVLALLYAAAGLVDEQVVFAVLLAGIGAATMSLIASSNSVVQMAAADGVRGRVMSVFMLVFVAGGAAGGPLIGWIDATFGAERGMLMSGAIAAVATIVIGLRLAVAYRRSGYPMIKVSERHPLPCHPDDPGPLL